MKTYVKTCTSLCSRNFQNVKLRLDFVEIWWFFCHSNFAWNQIWWIQTFQKCHFWPFQRFWMLNFGKFWTWKLLKLIKNQNSETLKLPKMTFLECLNAPKLDFTQNQSGGKIIKFQQSQALTSHFESFWSIVWGYICFW